MRSRAEGHRVARVADEGMSATVADQPTLGEALALLCRW